MELEINTIFPYLHFNIFIYCGWYGIVDFAHYPVKWVFLANMRLGVSK